MVNRARGEVPLLIEGEPHRLCLTLGALAEIEAGLELAALSELEARLARPRMRDLIVILGALLRGGGHDIEDAALARRQYELKAVGRAIAEAFAAAGLGGAPESESPPGEADAPRRPQRASGGAG